jgi:hypothetical protein
MDEYTAEIRDDGVGVFYLPSRVVFERITPRSEPTGLVFTDGSFLVVKEIFAYGFQDISATEPQIYFHEYGYHYQRPQDQTFFRYDYHPRRNLKNSLVFLLIKLFFLKEKFGWLP